MFLLKKKLTIFSIFIYASVYIVFTGSCTDNRNAIEYSASLKRKARGRIILTIGDSNGVVNGGWPTALQAVLKEDSVINNSEGGRTIGFDNCGSLSPHITIVTPPPYGPDSMVPDKALGGDYRVRLLVPQYRKVALKYDCAYVNIYPLIKPIFDEVVMDHVHLTREGHKIVADAITSVLNDWEAPGPPSDIGYENNFLVWNSSESSDVIGYEVIRQDRIITAVTGNRVELLSEIPDISVRARDGYGNISIAVTP